MRDTQALVKEFHEAFGLAIDQPVTRDTFELRASLLEEEMTEVREAVEEFNGLLYRPAYDQQPSQEELDESFGNLRKELADLRYVIDGLMVSFGVDSYRDTRIVHGNNMSKLGEDGQPIRRFDGKILKPKGFKKITGKDLGSSVQYDL